jgi:hypothetical protein
LFIKPNIFQADILARAMYNGVAADDARRKIISAFQRMNTRTIGGALGLERASRIYRWYLDNRGIYTAGMASI